MIVQAESSSGIAGDDAAADGRPGAAARAPDGGQLGRAKPQTRTFTGNFPSPAQLANVRHCEAMPDGSDDSLRDALAG